MGPAGWIMVAAACGMGWTLGANDGANSMGTAVGAGVRTMREATLLVAVCGFLGAALMGNRVITTIGNGIVPLYAVEPRLAQQIALSAILAASAWVLVATYFGWPVSTTHATVGAMAGAGVVARTVPVDWYLLVSVCEAWLLTPVGACVLGFIMYRVLAWVWERLTRRNDRLLAGLVTLSGVYMAFAWGANDVANATGPLVGAGLMSARSAALLGGCAISLGVMGWGYRVIETLGRRITDLVPLMALAAETAAAMNVHLYTAWGLPVATTHAIVGAVVGVGLAHGRARLNLPVTGSIVAAWTLTPVIAGLMAALIFPVAGLLGSAPN